MKEITEKSFTQKGNLVQHNRCYMDERPYSWSECGKSFLKKDNLVQHQKIHCIVNRTVGECSVDGGGELMKNVV
ncbi:hypothetical protein AB205_0133390 [Aquarana catesbeiana]|uniref:C2H2-type domain-containing protein n=1 Tax=Aquarana catesbeiana TaxID=8400 RepID=A0A2G9Q472_AQUCT|nr:hypothetical protein AB205_0133390 [Aquarana catesbeiana]